MRLRVAEHSRWRGGGVLQIYNIESSRGVIVLASAAASAFTTLAATINILRRIRSLGIPLKR